MNVSLHCCMYVWYWDVFSYHKGFWMSLNAKKNTAAEVCGLDFCIHQEKQLKQNQCSASCQCTRIPSVHCLHTDERFLSAFFQRRNILRATLALCLANMVASYNINYFNNCCKTAGMNVPALTYSGPAECCTVISEAWKPDQKSSIKSPRN